ncbi:MAG: hypothetical protein K0Q90_1726 [Paenibacillaceae bacterium]|nr:hypothetical protein [Paenibacillaceae bacterium]
MQPNSNGGQSRYLLRKCPFKILTEATAVISAKLAHLGTIQAK